MNWTEPDIEAVWNNGQIIERWNPGHWRKDACGAWIARADYENPDSDFGWQIDHILPVESGGTDDLANLRPLHWKNKASRRDGELTCPVTAYAGGNIDLSQWRAGN
jgi:HNH endonuclease